MATPDTEMPQRTRPSLPLAVEVTPENGSRAEIRALSTARQFTTPRRVTETLLGSLELQSTVVVTLTLLVMPSKRADAFRLARPPRESDVGDGLTSSAVMLPVTSIRPSEALEVEEMPLSRSRATTEVEPIERP